MIESITSMILVKKIKSQRHRKAFNFVRNYNLSGYIMRSLGRAMLNILKYLKGNMNDDDIDFINIFMVLFVNRLMHETKKVQRDFLRATCLLL